MEAVVLADGRVKGTWRYKRRSRALDLTVALFHPAAAGIIDDITTEAQRVATYFGLEPGEINFSREETV